MATKITTTEFIRRANLVHEEHYTYESTVYLGTKKKVIITCPVHGEFTQKAEGHLEGKGCSKCGYISSGESQSHTIDSFINKSIEIHQDRYDYSKVEYKRNNIKVNIICPIHGEFSQMPSSHLFGKGCLACAKLGFGWTDSDWEVAGLKSKKFDSFKVYVIRCFNENESFIKIGKTFKTIGQRFDSKLEMPYQWEIINTYEGDAKTMSILERKLIASHKEYKYSPLISFNGVTECFSTYNTNCNTH